MNQSTLIMPQLIVLNRVDEATTSPLIVNLAEK